MPSNDLKWRMMSAGLFMGPVALVIMAGAYLGRPGSVDASSTAAVEDTPVAVAAPSKAPALSWTDQSRAAAARALVLEKQGFGPSPFAALPTIPAPAVDATPSEVTPVQPAQPGVPPPPDVTVGMIITSSNVQTALIDGKPYRVGDALAESGWTIKAIDSIARSVTLYDPRYRRTMVKKVNAQREDGPSTKRQTPGE